MITTKDQYEATVDWLQKFRESRQRLQETNQRLKDEMDMNAICIEALESQIEEFKQEVQYYEREHGLDL